MTQSDANRRHGAESSSRPAPMDREPGTRLDQALALLEGIDQLVTRFEPLKHAVDRLTGLSPAEARALMGFADAADIMLPASRDTSAFAALADHGLIASHSPPPESQQGSTRWRITAAGRALLDQLHGLRIRILDTLLTTLDGDQIEAVHATLSHLTYALEGLTPPVQPENR